MTHAELIQTIEQLLEQPIDPTRTSIASLEGRLATIDQLMQDSFQRVESADYPFSVPVRYSSKITNTEGLIESDSAVSVFNSLSRNRRRLAYNIKLWRGYNGPKFVAEGDSWFEYPLLLNDVVDHLTERYAVYSLAGAGHLISDMLMEAEYLEIIRQEQPDFFLLSGGGNDLLQSGQLTNYLVDYTENADPIDLIDLPALDELINRTIELLRQMLVQVRNEFPQLVTLIHGYDYVLPRQNGTWLGTPFKERGIPLSVGKEIARILIDRWNARLKSLESMFPGTLFHIDCRGVVGSSLSFWSDELHPKDAGYGLVADRFVERIEAILAGRATTDQSGSNEFASLSGLTDHERRRRSIIGRTQEVSLPENRHMLTQARLLDSTSTLHSVPTDQPLLEAIIAPIPPWTPWATGHSASLAPSDPVLAEWQRQLTAEDRQAYDDYLLLRQRDPELDPEIVQSRRELASMNDPFTMERIIGNSNLYQINFLARGQRAARAVGRVVVMSRFGLALGSGTGFLIAPGLLITNHHVLAKAEYAFKSYVIFDYEYDADNELKSAELFPCTSEIYYSNPEHDFAIVSIAPTSRTGRPLSEFGYLPLIETPGKALPKEEVSIVQHPGGAPKQIALRDSTIMGRIRQYIYYTSDTNSGSSGSPVLNDDWLPVALHHRAVPNFQKPYDYVANRGVRISSIMEHLADVGKTQPAVQLIHERIRAAADGQTPHSNLVSTPTLNVPVSTMNTTEALREPFREPFSVPRSGYQTNFLGINVPLPTVRPEYQSIVARLMNSQETELKYEHFSIVMHKERRLALFTAANVDANPAKKRPDPNRPDRDYNRDGLTGLSKNDREKWYEDSRIESRDQLPDRFYSNDRGSFDKGHLIRREDVVWGVTYEELRRANGDTFFTTNCSPQVANFNQSTRGGEWGQLEDTVLQQAATEKLCVFAGPVLDPADRAFRGRDNEGTTNVLIPVKFWKLIVARSGNQLQAFAFLLEQDLSDVPFEFNVDSRWRQRMISIAALEVLVRYFRFPAAVRQADQYQDDG